MASCDWLVPLHHPERARLAQQAVRAALGRPTVSHIPADNPVSLDRTTLPLLQAMEYTAAHKADGVRYFLVLASHEDQPVGALVDRAGSTYQVLLHARKALYVRGSVFDGELCPGAGPSGEALFLVFNALVVSGVAMRDLDYNQRLHAVRTHFPARVLPSTVATASHLVGGYVRALDPGLHLLAKETVPFAQLASLPAVPYPTDGLLFTPTHEGVRSGRNPHLLKWKRTNPLDVRLRVEPDGPLTMTLDDDGAAALLLDVLQARYATVAWGPRMRLLEAIVRGAHRCSRAFSGRTETFEAIVELACERRGDDTLELNYLRLRPDKGTPNNVHTVTRTLLSIEDNITDAELLALSQRRASLRASRRAAAASYG